MTSALSIQSITKHHGAAHILKGVSLEVEAGEFLTLVGPSGCGKTSLLRIIAGLAAQDSGSIAVDGVAVDHLPPKARNIAMVFQSYALYPHMSVAENIANPLRHLRLPPADRLPLVGRWLPGAAARRREIAAEVEKVAEQVQLTHLMQRKPAQLSGGQRQRVALARAMVRQPSVFLMDEPLSNLDARLRLHMRGELSDLHRRLGATFIYVTHDQVEAMTMSCRVAVMMEGEVVQVATPAQLYDDPADLRVASFIGSPEINTLKAMVDADGRVVYAGQRLPLIADPAMGPLTLAVRPERLRLLAPGAAGEDGPRLSASLRRSENLGHETLLHLTPDQGSTDMVVRLDTAAWRSWQGRHGTPERLELSAAMADVLAFDADGRRLQAATAGQSASLLKAG